MVVKRMPLQRGCPPIWPRSTVQTINLSERQLSAAIDKPLALSLTTDSPKTLHRRFRCRSILSSKLTALSARASKRYKDIMSRTKPKMSHLPSDGEIERYAYMMNSLLNYHFQQKDISDWDICLIIAQRLIQSVASRQHDWRFRHKDRRAIAEKIHRELMFKGPIGNYCGIKSPGTWGIWSECQEPSHRVGHELMVEARKIGRHLTKLAAH